jgi:mRNA-degrading endonuclease RelE of RelBE toxin-antitoxin system
MYSIEYADDATEELRVMNAFHRRRIVDSIVKQLSHEPSVETKRKKKIEELAPSWYHEEPLWQLSVGEHRVYYDVDEAAKCVTVRAIRHKPPHRTTERIV